MTFITSDPTAIYRHALNAWVSPLATCALPKGVCYLLTYLQSRVSYFTVPPRAHPSAPRKVKTAVPDFRFSASAMALAPSAPILLCPTSSSSSVKDRVDLASASEIALAIFQLRRETAVTSSA